MRVCAISNGLHFLPKMFYICQGDYLKMQKKKPFAYTHFTTDLEVFFVDNTPQIEGGNIYAKFDTSMVTEQTFGVKMYCQLFTSGTKSRPRKENCKSQLGCLAPSIIDQPINKPAVNIITTVITVNHEIPVALNVCKSSSKLTLAKIHVMTLMHLAPRALAASDENEICAILDGSHEYT